LIFAAGVGMILAVVTGVAMIVVALRNDFAGRPVAGATRSQPRGRCRVDLNMSTKSPDPKNHGERGERDELWVLLGRARSAEVSADFARRTTMAVREFGAGDTPDPAIARAGGRVIAFPMLLRRAVISTLTAAAACMALLLLWQQSGGPENGDSGGLAATTVAEAGAEANVGIPLDVEPWEWELDELDWIDQVVAVNDPSVLSDAALAYLLY